MMIRERVIDNLAKIINLNLYEIFLSRSDITILKFRLLY